MTTLLQASGFSYENEQGNAMHESHDAMWGRNTPPMSMIELSELDRRELTLDRPTDSSSQQPTITCGTPMTRLLDRSEKKGNENCGASQSCNRVYVLYLPTAACPPPTTIMDGEEATTTTTSSSSSSSSSLRLPLVFAMHCLGCSPSTMMSWKELAEEYSFVLAIPEGIQNSFNAGHACCGYALENNVDDKGFVQNVISELESEFSFVSSKVVYAFGWSNGGYMVSYLAPLFRAVAPIAGYQVDLDDAISNDSHNQPTAVFLHHSQDDPFVQMTGCCTDPTLPSCCCALSNFDDTCTTLVQKAYEWSTRVNGCSSTSGGGSSTSSNQNTTTPSITYATPDVTCYSFQQCRANTTYCIHQNKGHFNMPSFAKAFPMFHEIAEFFARDACSSVHPPQGEGGRGQWIVDDSTAPSQQKRRGSCHCTQSWQGVYCLEDKVAMGATDATAGTAVAAAAAAAANGATTTTEQQSQTPRPSNSVAVQLKPTTAVIVLMVLATVVLSLFVFYLRANRQKKRYTGFSKVSTIELRSR
jgi:poly(3-hydroxybutyrate) depolymerase